MKFFRSTVAVGTVGSPEEVLSTISGSCGLWQIYICIVSFFLFFVYSMETFTLSLALQKINDTCGDGNKSCGNISGSECKNECFNNKTDNMVTLVGSLSLGDDRDIYILCMMSFYRLGYIIGPLLLGIFADKFGIRSASMVFIPLQFLTGILTTNMHSVNFLTAFLFTHSLFGSAICLFPLIAVCESSGNKYRTLNLGILVISYHICQVLFPSIRKNFSNERSLIAVCSILPLIVLIPLLFYRDSPNYLFFMSDFIKGEEIVRYIAKINKRPMSSEARIRPVHLISNKKPQRSTFINTWKDKSIRKSYLSLIGLYFLNGYYKTILLYATDKNFRDSDQLPASYLAACIIALLLLHVFSHKFFIGILNFIKSMCMGFLFASTTFSKKPFDSASILIYISGILLEMVIFALYNLTPRMYSTEQRTSSQGLCLSVFYLGQLVASVININQSEALYIVMCIFIVCPVFETLFCFFLWDVHKRELPDFLVDCVRFERFYKPTRYYVIYDQASEHEIEVKRLELSKDSRNYRRESGRLSLNVRFSEIIEIAQLEEDC